MTWNYRILKKGNTYGIHEVYYDAEGRPELCSMNAPTLEGFESLEDLVGDFALLKKAFDKPVLNYDDF